MTLDNIFPEVDKKNIYMDDSEYVKILEKIVDTVNADEFTPEYYDDDTNGSKRTWSNCGLCNDDDKSIFATKENVAFPDQFPRRRDFKYFKKHQLCPFDTRKEKDVNGCFFTCYLFKHGCNRHDIEEIRKMAADRLDTMKKNLKISVTS